MFNIKQGENIKKKVWTCCVFLCCDFYCIEYLKNEYKFDYWVDG